MFDPNKVDRLTSYPIEFKDERMYAEYVRMDVNYAYQLVAS